MKYIIEGIHERAGEPVRMTVEAGGRESAILEFWSRCLQPDLVEIEAVWEAVPGARVTTKRPFWSHAETKDLVGGTRNWRVAMGEFDVNPLDDPRMYDVTTNWPLEPECPVCGGAHTPYCRTGTGR